MYVCTKALNDSMTLTNDLLSSCLFTLVRTDFHFLNIYAAYTYIG